jgi:DNA-binding response OmpR family regulator
LRLDKLRAVKVLIIDHHARNARDLSQLLANCGYEGRTAHSGAAALRQVKEFTPDFVLLDLGLPDCDSSELAGLLKQACQPSCTVVGLGGQPTSANSKSIDCCLKKPFSFEALENILKRPRGREDSGALAPPDPLTQKVFDVLRKSLAPHPTELTAQEAQLLNELVKLPDARLASLLKRAADSN